MPVLYIPHGGGPLPLLGDAAHAELVPFLQAIPERLPRPSSILVVSAHWEQRYPTLTSAAAPSLLYDYGGFPPESYEIRYPAPGSPGLAEQARQLLNANGFTAHLDGERGFDHGMFVPLKLMYPDADIPCVQLSLLEGLDPEQHIRMGEALAPLLDENVLVLGSGSSFHNMRAMIGSKPGANSAYAQSAEFNDWLLDACTNPRLDSAERKQRLIDWEAAPQARYCHPREEHLLPLHACFGCASGNAAEAVFDGKLFGLAMAGLYWP